MISNRTEMVRYHGQGHFLADACNCSGHDRGGLDHGNIALRQPHTTVRKAGLWDGRYFTHFAVVGLWWPGTCVSETLQTGTPNGVLGHYGQFVYLSSQKIHEVKKTSKNEIHGCMVIRLPCNPVFRFSSFFLTSCDFLQR